MTDNPSSKPTHLEPSKLGTKEYWDSLYTTELTNHASDPSDRGTVWFDDSDAEAKLLEYLDDDDKGLSLHLDKRTTAFLDLGCGNGSLLLALRGDGWAGRCLGVDYSDKSVDLARRIAAAADGGGGGGGVKSEVEFEAWDVLQGDYARVLGGGEQKDGWDVVLDKGTFDAISLSEERDAQGRRICEGYKERVMKLVRNGGFFLVTSCNWTEEELEGWFGEGSSEVEGGRFKRFGRVMYPSFSFGGVKGQTISTLCFKRA